MENADKLVKVAREGDPDASAKLLQEAGGPCQAIELANAAKDLSQKDKGPDKDKGIVEYTVDKSGDKETLGLWIVHNDIWESVVAVDQQACKK